MRIGLSVPQLGVLADPAAVITVATAAGLEHSHNWFHPRQSLHAAERATAGTSIAGGSVFDAAERDRADL
jgi:hypothetical protein